MRAGTLLCSVRGCHRPLEREEHRVVCPRGHSFDIARSGYINLLQPQDRRSRKPGDTAEAIAARRRLHDRGVTAPLLDALADFSGTGPEDILLDAGCGEGFYSGSLAARTGCAACGVDISALAIDAAARRYPACEWIVANADRFIPYADATFSLVISITARMNAPEFRRVLRAGGRLVVAVPSPEDLIELRGAGRDRALGTIRSFAPAFALTGNKRVTTQAELDGPAVQDVLISIYRPLRAPEAQGMKLTFSLDLLLLEPV
jgi:23S rRNA (guanine745-N1)-methyltransferase